MRSIALRQARNGLEAVAEIPSRDTQGGGDKAGRELSITRAIHHNEGDDQLRDRCNYWDAYDESVHHGVGVIGSVRAYVNRVRNHYAVVFVSPPGQRE